MALSDFLAFVDHKLADIYHHVAPDPSKARAPFLKKIDSTIKQFGDGKQPRGEGKWWSAANNVVMFSPNIDGREIKVGKTYPAPIPAERFVDALNSLKAAVEAGELDDQLTGDGSEPAPKAKKASGTSTGRAGWTEERKQRFAATLAAKKAAKEAGK